MNIDKNAVIATLRAMGIRLRRARLDANLTQNALATRAGVSLKTVRNAEDGQNISLETLVLLLQGVGRQQDLERLLASNGPSPIDLAERQGRARQRATGRRTREPSAKDAWQW
jgi:putative transcriptional regulator